MPRQDKKSLLAVPDSGGRGGLWGRVSHARWARLLVAWTRRGEGHRERNRHVWSSHRKCIGSLGTGRAAQDGVGEGDLDIPDIHACLFTGAHRWGTHMRTHKRRPWWYPTALIEPDRGSKGRSSCHLLSSPLQTDLGLGGALGDVRVRQGRAAPPGQDQKQIN